MSKITQNLAKDTTLARQNANFFKTKLSKTMAPNISQIRKITGNHTLTIEQFKAEVIADYRLAVISREVSLISFKDVQSYNRAQFAIVGDGKELPQIVLSKFFQKGDWRSGYYRDQTLALALDIVNVEQLFAQLYADTNPENDIHSAGRMMNNHFATANIDEQGNWLNLMAQKNVASDMSSTAAQMPRSVGLALASKHFRHTKALQQYPNIEQLTNNGNEICYCTIGDASTSEGHFWETINAAGVLQIPLVVSVWDDGMGISVERRFQTTKSSISEVLKGFERGEKAGFAIFKVAAWDYMGLYETYKQANELARNEHVPVLVHVIDVTQPLGHSTSGGNKSKTADRLTYEQQKDCNACFRQWILDKRLATEEMLTTIDNEARQLVIDARNSAWEKNIQPVKEAIHDFKAVCATISSQVSQTDIVAKYSNDPRIQISKQSNPSRREVAQVARQLLFALCQESEQNTAPLQAWIANFQAENQQIFSRFLHTERGRRVETVEPVAARYSATSPKMPGNKIINACFDKAFERDPRLVVFGEDVGKIGDVNACLAGLQAKYGEERIFDTGIRELTIMGQGIGMALRGLRPVAEIQYLDYFLYGLQPISDDLACLQYRTYGKQHAPLIIRTRGHRLVGIWHSGSPMGLLLSSVRGVHIAVPRNMVQAAGMYNSLWQCDEPAIVVECLNAYNKAETLPDNIGEFCVPFGVPEILREGSDVTLVTYGACCPIAIEAAQRLASVGIECEVMDVQTLLPFDIHEHILQSVKKTNRLLVIDEDVPGGASAYLLQHIVEQQGAYRYLDSAPQTLSGKAHRPAYGMAGDYYSKPNEDDIVEKVYQMMHESDPQQFPLFFGH